MTCAVRYALTPDPPGCTAPFFLKGRAMYEEHDLEFAKQEFSRWVDAMDIDEDTTGLDENDLNDMSRNRMRIIRGVQKSLVTIDEMGVLSVIPKKGEPEKITFHEANGDAYTAMDKRKKTQDFGKMFSSMATVCKVNAATFVGLRAVEVKICMAVWNYFLA